MTTVAYCHPLVPPEWIAAHGVRPRWLHPRQSANTAVASAARGMCPYAGAVVDAARSGLDAAALVLTTVCDPMRYGAAVLDRLAQLPVFLFNVPSTWQTPTAREMYVEELRRLGRFLVQLGGTSPRDEELGRSMLAFDSARSTLLEAKASLSARQVAQELIHLRSAQFRDPTCGRGAGDDGGSRLAPSSLQREQNADPAAGEARPSPPTPLPSNGRGEQIASAVPLAIVGGPLVEKDFDLFDLVDRLGGRVVLDATEGGTRMLPAPFDLGRVADDPLAELARAYFEATPDVFRRPNDALYTWLGSQFERCAVRGVLFRRYVWCDLWHAELNRLRQWSPVPVLEIDVNHDDRGVPARIVGRVEAFLEMLR